MHMHAHTHTRTRAHTWTCTPTHACTHTQTRTHTHVSRRPHSPQGAMCRAYWWRHPPATISLPSGDIPTLFLSLVLRGGWG